MLNWRDLKNPKGGGAEVLTEGILAELVHMGHEVVLFTSLFPGAKHREYVNGYEVIRKGSPLTVHMWAFIFWLREFRKRNFDYVVDQIHGIPFFTIFYVARKKRIAFIHEVAGDIWFEMFPKLIAYFGIIVEQIYFYLYRTTKFITVSESTKRDLIRVGIPEKNISITPEAIIMPPEMEVEKSQNPTLIFVGRLAPMKRVEHFLEASALAKKVFPNLETWIVGGGEEEYVRSLKSLSESLGGADQKSGIDATFFGRLEWEKKFELMGRAHLLVSASVKEGYGLVILEAGTMGTPSVTYNVHGFRDAIIDGKTGLLSKENTPESLAGTVVGLLKDRELYETLSRNTKEHSLNFTFENAAKEFEKIILQK